MVKMKKITKKEIKQGYAIRKVDELDNFFKQLHRLIKK